MNPSKKSDFEVLSMKTKQKYESIDSLKKQVVCEFGDKVGQPLKQLGYIEPGHGLRGKQRWLSSTEDLLNMYEIHGKKEITLWCFGNSGTKKRQLDDTEENGGTAPKVPRTSSNYIKHTDKVSEVHEIECDLKKRHGDKYSDAQYRAWANLIQMKKHESLEHAPDLPFWRGYRKKSTETVSVSPGKRINLRGQCVDQLLKWHQLLEKGAITKEQYDELHCEIIKDVKKF